MSNLFLLFGIVSVADHGDDGYPLFKLAPFAVIKLRWCHTTRALK